MSETLDIDQPTCGSPERFGVHHEMTEEPLNASARPTRLFQPSPADWEKWIVRISEWRPDAGEEDCDGVVWPTEFAIQAALQVIQRLRTKPFAEPTEIVPSGDGGIFLSQRSSDFRHEIHVSESGETELLVFSAGRLINRTTW